MHCSFSFKVYGEAVIHSTGEVVYERDVPCGKCAACNSRHAYNVYKRLEYESSLYDEFALFVTLTYDEDHVPVGPAYRPVISDSIRKHPVSGLKYPAPDRYRKSKQAAIDFADEHCTSTFLHVSKSDWQTYMKALRYRLGTGLRFFTLAEYGGETARPHYHMLLFNHGLGLRSQAQAFDASSLFAAIWGKGFALCEIAPTSAMKYVSGYHAIRQFSPLGSTPSFILSSRNPGIGHLSDADAAWVKDHSFTDRAHSYLRLSSYQRKQVYPDGDFLVSTVDQIVPDSVSESVDQWFLQQKLRDHGKFTNRLNSNSNV